MTEPATRNSGVRVQKLKLIAPDGYAVADAMTHLSRSKDKWRAKHGLPVPVYKALGRKALTVGGPPAAYKLRRLFFVIGEAAARPMAIGVDEATGSPTIPQDPLAASRAPRVVEQWYGHAVQVEDDNSVWVDLQSPGGDREQALFTSEDFTPEQWPEILTGRTFKYTRLRGTDGSTSTEVREIEILRGQAVPEDRRQETREHARALLQHARRDG